MTLRSVAAVLATALIVAACATSPVVTPSPAPAAWASQGARELVPIVVSSELAVGPNRLLLNVVDRQNQPVAAPDRRATLNLYDLAADTSRPVASVEATYMTVLEQLPGLYRAQVQFGHAGEWGVEVVTDEPGGTQRSGRLAFPVRETTTTPALGGDAPKSQTPTADSPDQIRAISTDTDPDADFYRQSVDQAIAAGQPFMVVFATPAFCRTATCGPALDVVKSVAPDFKERVAFIHVEPYQLHMVDGQLQPVFDANNNPIPVESVREWGLPTEPYVFAVDSSGKVRAKLDGIAGADELREALTLVSR